MRTNAAHMLTAPPLICSAEHRRIASTTHTQHTSCLTSHWSSCHNCTSAAMAAARGFVSKLLQLQGRNTHRLSGTGVGALAGFFSAAAVASASGGGDNNACPAYPWPQDGVRGGPKVFMQHDCAACHSMLPYAGLTEAAAAGGGEVEATSAEIVVVHEQAQPEPAAALHGSACPPDLSVIAKMLEELRHSNLYTADEMKKRMALPTPVWLQFLQPYLRNPQAA